jgi:hypothetical protein
MILIFNIISIIPDTIEFKEYLIQNQIKITI